MKIVTIGDSMGTALGFGDEIDEVSLTFTISSQPAMEWALGPISV